MRRYGTFLVLSSVVIVVSLPHFILNPLGFQQLQTKILGINLRTGDKGIFPLAHVVDVEYNDFDPAGVEEKKERYLLDYLGSVQCAQKGVEIIVQVIGDIIAIFT